MLSDAEKSLLLRHVKETRHPLVVIVGPTASGKTGLSLAIAKTLGNAEIVNADSRQLYQYLNIGTAKIRPEDMQNIPHHLIDVLDPKEPVSIAWYQEHARRVIEEIRGRGNIPILVGGSMLYVSSVIDGLIPLPSDPELRKRLEKEAATDEGAKSMHARLKEIDPEAAADIHPNNKVYLVRAMELAMLHEAAPTVVKKRNTTDDDLLIFGTRMEKEILKKNISTRIDAMFADGWINEVRSLLDRGYTKNDPAMESSGYREIIAALESETTDDPVLRKTILDSTMRYAKRQVTWWRHDGRIHLIDVLPLP